MGATSPSAGVSAKVSIPPNQGNCERRREQRLRGDCVEKLLFGYVQFSRRPTSAAFKKSAGGPANLSIGQRARSSTGLRCVERRCSIELQFGEFSSRSIFDFFNEIGHHRTIPTADVGYRLARQRTSRANLASRSPGQSQWFEPKADYDERADGSSANSISTFPVDAGSMKAMRAPA